MASINWQDELAHSTGEIEPNPHDDEYLPLLEEEIEQEPEPEDEQDRRAAPGPTFAEGQQRLACALDALTVAAERNGHD